MLIVFFVKRNDFEIKRRQLELDNIFIFKVLKPFLYDITNTNYIFIDQIISTSRKLRSFRNWKANIIFN